MAARQEKVGRSIKWVLISALVAGIMLSIAPVHAQEDRGGTREQGPNPNESGKVVGVRPPREEKVEVVAPVAEMPPAAEGSLPAGEGKLEREAGEGEELFTLNFERTAVGTLAREILAAIGASFISDARLDVPGMEVTVRTAGKVKKKDLFPLLEAVLRLKNLSITRLPDGFYQIDALQPTKPGTVPAGVGGEVTLAPDSGLILQIVPIKYVPAADLQQIVDRFLSKSGTAITHGVGNNLLLVDYPGTVADLLEIIELLDVPPVERVFMLVENADLDEMVETLEEIFALEIGAAKGGGMLQFVPLHSLGGILVKNSSEPLLPEVARWVKLLDVVPTERSYRTYYYHVKARPATVIRDIVEELFAGMKEIKELGGGTAAPRPQPSTPRGGGPQTTSPSGAATATEELYISVDATRNMLIIYTTPQIYESIKATIEEIDQPPRQVLIEATIAEVSLQGTYELGLEWALKAEAENAGPGGPIASIITFGAGGSEFPDATTFPAGPLGGGLSYLIAETGKFLTLLRALETEDRLQVIASPSILASMGIEETKEGTEGKEAEVNVELSIPIRRATVSEGGIVSQDFEYVPIPIRLRVTPSAIWADSVSLHVDVEVSTALGGSLDVPPEVNSRTVTTDVTIADGQTLVIGGLINRSKEEFRQSVPILGRIPVLGRVLFTSKSRPQDVTTEIVVVLTPRVIDTTAEGDEVSAKAKELIKPRSFRSSRAVGIGVVVLRGHIECLWLLELQEGDLTSPIRGGKITGGTV